VVLLVDGAESCGGDAVAAAAALRAHVPVHVLGYAVSDAAMRVELDAIAGGRAFFFSNPLALSIALESIANRAVADSLLVEACNGRDDDCDGQIDEGCQWP
jgi:hypothetical protein